MKKPLLVSILVFNLFILNSLYSQYLYNYEDFLSDSAFVLKKDIKVVTIRIPELMGDTSIETPAYQKLCFNSFGKLAWFEFDSIENNVRRKFYTWHFYDDKAQRFKTRIFQRCDGRDSLREEIQYHYHSDGRLALEDHYQIYIAAYREWSFAYEWQGDTMCIKGDDLGNLDTARYNNKIQPTNYTQEDWRYEVEYDDKGRKSLVHYFTKKDGENEESKIDDVHYIYDDRNRLEKIETSTRTISFLFDSNDLPISSFTLDKGTGNKVGFQVFYDYEFKNDAFARQN
jgi:YD repeat-containing protein